MHRSHASQACLRTGLRPFTCNEACIASLFANGIAEQGRQEQGTMPSTCTKIDCYFQHNLFLIDATCTCFCFTCQRSREKQITDGGSESAWFLTLETSTFWVACREPQVRMRCMHVDHRRFSRQSQTQPVCRAHFLDSLPNLRKPLHK
jgi:hypothetical protein